MTDLVNRIRANIAAIGGSEARAIASNSGLSSLWNAKHTPSGMYFCPSRKVKVNLSDDSSVYEQIPRYIKSNLSKDGKAYTRRPSLKQIGTHYYTHHLVNSAKDLDHGIIGEYKMLEVVPDEWIIEEIA